MSLLTFLFIIVFLIGLFFYAKTADPKYREGLFNNTSKCPNLLIQKGSKIYLYNSKVAQVPGVNPVVFNNLEEYTDFLNWQRSQGIRCPVLYLQESYDAQGNTTYKIRPSITEPQGGLPPSKNVQGGISEQPPSMPISIASSSGNIIKEPSLGTDTSRKDYSLLVDATRNDPPYNKNSYPAYDQSSYYVGKTTPLDMMNIKRESSGISPNPMDENWGGADYTQSLIIKGVYKNDNVAIYVES